MFGYQFHVLTYNLYKSKKHIQLNVSKFLFSKYERVSLTEVCLNYFFTKSKSNFKRVLKVRDVTDVKYKLELWSEVRFDMIQGAHEMVTGTVS